MDQDIDTVQRVDPTFPCSLLISLPLPTLRLATSAKRALEVDTELSPLVRRSFSVVPRTGPLSDGGMVELRTFYEATTNRMLRVAVNGFMESLGVVLGVMEELDVDVMAESAY
ncbi:MAG: hypothetical protein M1816_007851 [Peltula sp. TS41687]|nr:MAG: hypothetical protein M1816_007851 [Peltula sp. TS41687]